MAANVFIQVDKPFYSAGQTVNGHVFLNLFQNIQANEVILKFKGWESVRWIQQRIVPEQERQNIHAHMIWNNTYFVRMDSSDSSENEGEQESMKFNYVMEHGQLKQITRLNGGRIIARFSTVLHNFGGSYIPSGQYSFPFSFKTGDNYPSTFREKASDQRRKGRIKYEMQAFIRAFNSKLRILKCKTQIAIHETTVIKNEKQEMVAHVKSCCCVDQGTSIIKCYFQKNAYYPGEDAKIYCMLNTLQSKTNVEEVRIQLINDITYTSKENRTMRFHNTLFTQTFAGLPMGQEGQRETIVKMINTKHKNDLFNISPTARGQKLHSVYYLKVEAILAASCTCCSELPAVNQPILIYPYMQVVNFNAPQNWHPQVMPMLNVKLNVGINNENLQNMGNPYA